MNANIVEKASRIVGAASEAYIGLIDEAGRPSVSTLSSIETDGIFRAFYSTGLRSNKAQRILANPAASVCYHSGNDNVTLVGTACMRTDAGIRHALWQDWFINHFPTGKDDPNYGILEFETERVSLWIDGESAEFRIAELLAVQSRCGLLCNGCEYREPYHCGGCIETCGQPFHGACPVAACCQEKGHEHCGMCEEMPCEKLHAYSCLDKEHGDVPPGARLAVLRRWRDAEKTETLPVL